jgi:hypothetical protein
MAAPALFSVCTADAFLPAVACHFLTQLDFQPKVYIGRLARLGIQ